MDAIKRFLKDESGLETLEWVTIGTLVVLAAAGGATLLGTNLDLWYTNVGTEAGLAASDVDLTP